MLVPLQCEYYALEGLTHLMATIDRVKNGMNAELELEGIVLTMFDPRNNLAHQVADEVKKHFHVFDAVIPRNVRLSEAPSHGKPVILYDVSSKGSQGYLALAREMLERHAKESGAQVAKATATGRIDQDAGQGSELVTTPPVPPRRALGRGLDALLPSAPSASTLVHGSASANGGAAAGERLAFLCALEKLVPQKGQPRRHFDPQALEELAQSIKEHGLLEPIVVRRVPNQGAPTDRFEIIAGERRWRASQKAGLREALVVVKDVSPEVAFELALVENVQREDLNAVEIAEALDRLIKEHGYTQETVAARVGKERSTVTNHLRLLKLPAEVRDRIVTRELSEGHARALLGAKDEEQIRKLAEKVVRGKLSVRATEALVRGAGGAKDGKNGAKAGASSRNGAATTPAIRDLETKLARALGTRCEVRDKGNKGEIAIPYTDLDQLDRILEKLL